MWQKPVIEDPLRDTIIFAPDVRERPLVEDLILSPRPRLIGIVAATYRLAFSDTIKQLLGLHYSLLVRHTDVFFDPNTDDLSVIADTYDRSNLLSSDQNPQNTPCSTKRAAGSNP